jgi:RHS repeat-associated protein
VAHTSVRRVRRRRLLLAAASIVAAISLIAGLLTVVGVFGGWGRAPKASAGRPIAVHPVQGRKVPVPAMRPWSRPRTSWPAAETATAVIAGPTAPHRASRLQAGPSAGSGRAGTTPVWIGAPDTPAAKGTVTSASLSKPAVSRVRVSMATHATADALGVRGVIFSLARSDGSLAGGRVHVSLSYSAFAQAAGGSYASRLRLVELPGCALTTPQLAQCRKQTPVRSADNVRVARLGADVNLPGLAASAAHRAVDGGAPAALVSSVSPAPVVLAAAASASGSGGNFAAEPSSEADAWVAGGSSGAFAHSYPIGVPPVPGGLEPHVSLDYRSQAVDGLTSATNNEASWVGDGWDYSPGYIEVEYPTCSTQTLQPVTGDLCPGPGTMILSRNGVSTPLVGSGSTFKEEADGGEKTVNQGGYWEVIEPDGTQYYFGMNQLPGYASGDATTNSVWTVPVASGSGFVAKPWRYMLDYVVDPRGNAIAYFYNTQTNYYAENNGSTGTGAYTQGGTLAKIEYGLRAGAVYGTTPAAQVNFTTSSTVRADAPTDLACAQNAACTVTSPTFWTSYALTGISTQSLVSGSLRNVDSWALNGTYPATGDSTTSPSLWLSSVTRTGQDGTTAITLPPVSFAGTPMPNRVQTAADTSAGYSLITRFRLTSITSETGGVTTVVYSSPDAGACAVTGSFPSPDANTAACYPSYWYPALPSLSQVQDWFNLYSVSKVTDQDTTGGDPPVVTSFSYAGAAWRYDDDTVSRSATVTWNQWRGFRTLTTEHGTSPDPVTQTTDTYLQGMDQDKTSTGVASVKLTSTRGDQVTDSNQYAGMLFEAIDYNGAGTGNQVTDTVDIPYTSNATAQNSSLHQSAFITGTSSVDTYTTLAGGGSRESIVTKTFDTHGQVLTESDVPDTANPAEDTCTTTTYATNATTGLVDLPATVQVVDLPCSTTPTLASQLVSDTQYTYDNGGTLSAGNLTKAQVATAVSVQNLFGVFVFQYTYTTEQTATYDQYGRVLTSADADNRTTTTAYTPATGAEPTSVAVTDPATLVTTTTYDPARDLPTSVTDPATHQSAETYDALGRVTSQWTPGNATSGPAVDKYTYAVSATAPSVTTEQAEEPGGGYLTSKTLSDSLGQVRETQQATAGGGTDVADTTYNSDGWKTLVSDPYYTSGAPSGTLVSAGSGSVPSQTGYVYDGDGRVTKQVAYALGTETWETDTTYGGNYVTVVPPSGGTSQTTFTDGRGLTTAIYQYHAGVPASPSDPSSQYDQTSYTYTTARKLASITDAANNAWSWTYDLLGNQLTATDPDAGATTNTYDAASQLMTVTDARGKQVSYTYDGDGRKTAEYDTTGGALENTSDRLASWIWDTLAKGKLTSSTSYSGGAAYTEAVTGYNSYELPSGTQTVVPSAQGALAGTYTQQDSYAPDGQLTSYTDSAAGGLPAETVTTGYDSAGEANSLTGTGTYVNSLSYTNLGEPLQYTMGTSSQPAYTTDSYDSQTRRLSEQNTQTGTAQTSVDDLHYSYDHVGNITSEADTPAGAASSADVQCFHYDYLGRLVQAWAQGSTGCASTPSAPAEGGAAPYWNAYSYNTAGNLTGITSTTPTGAVTTTTDGYPAAGAARPHAITTSQVTKSSGSTNTSYGYDASGHLTTVTATAQSEALTWNDAGLLAQAAITPSGGSAKNTSYIYNTDGTVLLTADPATTTLYLPDEELSLSTGSGTVTGTRYYSIGSVTVATRTGASSVAFVAGDTQGTDSVAIDSQTLSVTHRYYDPYGNPRGTAPPSFPTGEKGFVGGASDTATGLTDLGVRQYQPGTGSFISPDPLLNPYDPQDLNAYTYAADNPSTKSDPTGAMPCDPDGRCGSTHALTTHPVQSDQVRPKGYNPPPSDSGCPPTELTCTVPLPYTNAGRDSYQHPGRVKPAPVTARHGPTTASRNLGRDLRKHANQAAQDLLNGGKDILGLFSGGLGLFSGGLGLFSGGLGLFSGGFDLLQGGLDVAMGGGIAGLCGQSFTAGTKVLLASGAAIPIAGLKPGDKILATNVKTGKTRAETVSAVLVHHDTDLYDLKIKAGTRTAVIKTTANHLFWDSSARRWVKAASLHRGDHLRTPTGATATVAGGYTPSQDIGWMWDLTIPGDHDFYIKNVTSLLVHNDECPPIANSKVNIDAGTYKTRDQALDAAKRDRAEKFGSNVKTILRLECKEGKCHIHVDVYNKRGQILQTWHYNYQQQ